ncbi:MAG: proline--tRNA ligase, partial [Alphaproteobacteria bacterium]|nr:proline--tRNA ligase [Alphaproteobacteria bacterium]
FQIFRRIGVTAIPLKADTGAIGGSLSHEFHILAESGESGVFYDPKILELDNITLSNYQDFYAATDEKHDANLAPANVVEKRGIEVGHVFYLGQKYSNVLNAKIQGKFSDFIHPYMGCYGIGVSRVVAAVIEASNDEKGIIWPEAIAPFKLIVTPLKVEGGVMEAAERIYNAAKDKGIEVIIDDRDLSAGNKLATADLIGIPYQIVIGNKSIENNAVEFKKRGGDTQNVSLDSIEQLLAKLV